MRRNFYAPVLAVGGRDEKRRTQRYLSGVINATIDVEVLPERSVLFPFRIAYKLVNLYFILVLNLNKFLRPQKSPPRFVGIDIRAYHFTH